MGENSKIEWTTHSWSPWRGCSKVSPGCTHCYAETLSKRNPGVLGVWGDEGARVVAAGAAWRLLFKWNRQAKAAGERWRIFPSLCDPFEDRPELDEPLARYLHEIQHTPNLDHLVLTKRPENWRKRLLAASNVADDSCHPSRRVCDWIARWLDGNPPKNVWLGVSTENQKYADERIPHLLRTPAAVRFLSVEPMIGPIDLRAFMPIYTHNGPPCCVDKEGWHRTKRECGLHWVIVGGESGHGARPMNSQWARDIRDQCVAAGVPYFFKQHGEWGPRDTSETQRAVNINLKSTHFPQRVIKPLLTHLFDDGEVMVRVGKKLAGRLLDGEEWNQMPVPTGATP